MGNRKRKAVDLQEKVTNNQTRIAVALENTRERESASFARRASSAGATSSSGDMVQTQSTLMASAESLLSTACADYVYATGLPFSSFNNVYFRQILKYAKMVGKGYKVSARVCV